MKYWLTLIIMIPLCGTAASTQQVTKVVDCKAIFEDRKQELDLKIDAIRKEQSNLDALKGASLSLQTQRERKIELKAKEVLNNLKLISDKEASIQQSVKLQQEQMKKMIDENKKILDEIKNAKDDKVLAVYMKMKPGSSAAIFSEMNATAASNLIARMDPKKAAEVLSKMDAKKASAITEAMKK